MAKTTKSTKIRSTRFHQFGAALAFGLGCALTVTTPAQAQPTADRGTRGMPTQVFDVLQPDQPEFWNPAVSGTRVLATLTPGDIVICATGDLPPVSCSKLPMASLQPQRPLTPMDLPVPGFAPTRVWVDTPRLGDGSTERITSELTMLYLSPEYRTERLIRGS